MLALKIPNPKRSEKMNDSFEELNPIDCKAELLQLFQAYPCNVYTSLNEGYEYLSENSCCIAVVHPITQQELYVDLEDEREFTLSFAVCHSHYFPSQEDYSELKQTILKILQNEVCSASLWYGEDEKKWLGSLWINKTELEQPISQMFGFVWKTKEFRKRLNRFGGEVRFRFWDSKFDKTILLPKK